MTALGDRSLSLEAVKGLEVDLTSSPFKILFDGNRPPNQTICCINALVERKQDHRLSRQR